MKLITLSFCIVILLCLNIEVHSQIITIPNNPVYTQTQYEYRFISGFDISFSQWIILSDLQNYKVVNSGGLPYPNGIIDLIFYIKWSNVEANAKTTILKASYWVNNTKLMVEKSVGPFILNLPPPAFSLGTSTNIPWYSTNPVTITLNPYINTQGYDQGLTITDHFEWTLPAG